MTWKQKILIRMAETCCPAEGNWHNVVRIVGENLLYEQISPEPLPEPCEVWTRSYRYKCLSDGTGIDVAVEPLEPKDILWRDMLWRAMTDKDETTAEIELILNEPGLQMPINSFKGWEWTAWSHKWVYVPREHPLENYVEAIPRDPAQGVYVIQE